MYDVSLLPVEDNCLEVSSSIWHICGCTPVEREWKPQGLGNCSEQVHTCMYVYCKVNVNYMYIFWHLYVFFSFLVSEMANHSIIL